MRWTNTLRFRNGNGPMRILSHSTLSATQHSGRDCLNASFGRRKDADLVRARASGRWRTVGLGFVVAIVIADFLQTPIRTALILG